MYGFLKKTIKKIFPQKFLFRAEPFLRRTYAVFFRGHSFRCNICEDGIKRFIRLENGELLCPRCGSLPRDRRLFDLIQAKGLLKGKMLDFSPSRALYRKYKQMPGLDYVAAGFSDEFITDQHVNITDIQFGDNFFDLVVCYHVLEHVNDDKKAMTELYRVMKPGAHLFLQTPFREGGIFEDPAITTEQDRLIHFGQKDHVRIYSLEGLSERLCVAGFEITVLQFNEQTVNPGGFSEKEFVLQGKKGVIQISATSA